MRTKQKHFQIFFLIVIFFIFGCNNDDFSPIRGHELSVLNVYSILDTRSSMQFLKIQKSYFDQSANSSLKTNFDNIKITIISSKYEKFSFRDTIIDGFPDYKVLFYPNMKLQRKTSYNLSVDNNSSIILSSSTYIPSKPEIYIQALVDSVIITVKRYDAFAGDFHVYLEYLKSINGIITIDRVEVPISHNIQGKDTSFIYPEIYKKYEFNPYIKLDPNSEIIPYLKYFFNKAIDQASKSPGFLRINKCYLLFFSYNSDFWYYYNSIKGFNDPYSIRMDKPYWTNISNGAGFFGSVAVDSVVCPMPY